MEHSSFGGTSGKDPACQYRDIRDVGSIPGSGRSPGEGRAWQPIPVFLLGELYGQRSLEGYSLWGRKELDTTERLTLLLSKG